jgi:hypothetical protein
MKSGRYTTLTKEQRAEINKRADERRKEKRKALVRKGEELKRSMRAATADHIDYFVISKSEQDALSAVDVDTSQMFLGAKIYLGWSPDHMKALEHAKAAAQAKYERDIKELEGNPKGESS